MLTPVTRECGQEKMMVAHARVYDQEDRHDGEWITTPEIVVLDATRGEVVTVDGVYELGSMGETFKGQLEAMMGYWGVHVYDRNYPEDHMGAAVQGFAFLHKRSGHRDHTAPLHPLPGGTERYEVARAAGLRTGICDGLETLSPR